MRIATYNVNSVNARLPVLLRWLSETQPDIACLQELKAPQDKFPEKAIREAGYGVIWHGQKSYNGVAILARGRDPVETQRGLPGDPHDLHSRYIEASVGALVVGCLYLPNGNPVGSDKFAYKLAWMDRLNQQMIRWKQDDVPTLIGGDFNVIPEDIDCHKPSSWEHDALFQPEPRARYRAMLDIGYTDAFRCLHVDEKGHFTFWDYFRQAFQNNRGIRIDHFLLSSTLAKRLEGCEIDKGPRAQEKSSDHTPIIVTLSDLP